MAYILAVLGRGTGPKGDEMAGRSLGTNSQDLATILGPFRAISRAKFTTDSSSILVLFMSLRHMLVERVELFPKQCLH